MFDMNNQEGRKQQRRLTQAEVECWLYTGVESGIARKVNDLLKGLSGASMAGTAGHEGAFIPTAEPRKNPRPARFKDLEDGCILRWCGNRPELRLTPGKEYKIEKCGDGFYIPYDDGGKTGVLKGFWSNDYGDFGRDWEFVSNPNYVHGFRIGETVYSTGGDSGKWGSSSGFGPYTVVKAGPGSFSSQVVVNNGGCYPPEYLTRDETKGKGYKAPVATYKVRDGEVQEGGDMWWLGCAGPKPAKMTPGGVDYRNCKEYPQVYQLAEPEFDMVRIPGSYEPVKSYRYMQAPYNGNSRAYYAAAEKQAIPEPKDWRAGDILRFADNAENRAVAGLSDVVIGKEATFVSFDQYRYQHSGGFVSTKGNSDCYASRFEWVRRP